MTIFESLIAEFAEKTGQKIAPSSGGSVVVEADGMMITVQSARPKARRFCSLFRSAT